MLLEYSSQAPYPPVQRRLPGHLLTANEEPNYRILIPEAYINFQAVPDIIRQTDLFYMTVLSNKLGNDIYLKREDTQLVHSFKIRGGYNIMTNLEPGIQGVATASAG
jgi:threonine dehydratase